MDHKPGDPTSWTARRASTTYHWEYSKIRRSRQGKSHSASGASTYLPLVRRHWGKPLVMTMTYVGGSMGSCVIETRGARWVVPGGLSVVEMLQWVNGRTPKDPDQ
jgi:hypothetical protein